MEIMGVSGVAAISVICYLLAEIVKAWGGDGRWLPALCGGLGAGLGVAGMYLMAEFPAADPLTALAVGAVSGLAATGGNELVKQLKKEK